MRLEYRSTYEVRADAEAGGFSGYAATFNRVDSYGTALAERGDRSPVLYNHNQDANVGVPETLTADKDGLKVEARLFDDGADGTVLLARLRQGARFGMSFGFQTLQSRSATEDDTLDLGQLFEPEAIVLDGIRVITEVKLYEVSVVSFPANEAAGITDVRNAAMADALAEVLSAVRDGSLDERQRGMLDAIVAAYSPLSPDGNAEPREPEIARRRIDADIALARFSAYRRAA
jgi:HK97 family phage prohead protease